jgi:choline dehydrogenase-like flavoprotein
VATLAPTQASISASAISPVMIAQNFELLESTRCDVCIIGSGPVGSALAVDLVRRGLSVILLESGLANPDAKILARRQCIDHPVGESVPAMGRNARGAGRDYRARWCDRWFGSR